MPATPETPAAASVDPAQRAELARRACWIFDMDGTLTHAVHDFDAIRAELGLPAGLPILEHIAALPAAQAERINARLYAIERELARLATPQPGARILLERLRDRGRRLGIVTRNSEALAHITLAACGLDDLFDPACVLGRERCAPKPDPAGILMLMTQWRVDAADVVMVGDYVFDLKAGRDAGAMTVHYDALNRSLWTEHRDLVVNDFDQLLGYL